MSRLYFHTQERTAELHGSERHRERPWAQLSPDTLGEVFVQLPVSVYDLFAPDRDERVRRAADVS